MPDALRDFITVPEESLIPLVSERAMEIMLADALYRDGWRERMCGRKRRYSSLREAREYAKVVRKHTGGPHELLRMPLLPLFPRRQQEEIES